MIAHIKTLTNFLQLVQSCNYIQQQKKIKSREMLFYMKRISNYEKIY